MRDVNTAHKQKPQGMCVRAATRAMLLDWQSARLCQFVGEARHREGLIKNYPQRAQLTQYTRFSHHHFAFTLALAHRVPEPIWRVVAGRLRSLRPHS